MLCILNFGEFCFIFLDSCLGYKILLNNRTPVILCVAMQMFLLLFSDSCSRSLFPRITLRVKSYPILILLCVCCRLSKATG